MVARDSSATATELRLKRILRDTLQLGGRAELLTPASRLLGAMPEFDSMAVVAVLTMIEDDFGIPIHDDDVTADVFETLGSLARFVDSRVGS